jgi:hypothetical protein
MFAASAAGGSCAISRGWMLVAAGIWASGCLTRILQLLAQWLLVS